MPHQCLKCGHVFQEGSPQLLKGCPNCGGNRFFYTKKPLDENQRKNKSEEVSKDINNAIMKIIEENAQTVDKTGDWINIKPTQVSKVLKKELSKNKNSEQKMVTDIEKLTNEEYRRKKIEEVMASVNSRDKPETIYINKPGDYIIDLKGLMEEEPIVIQKDGSYTIHLPSVFKAASKKKQRR